MGKKYSDYYDEVINHGIKIFGDKEKFLKWLDCFCLSINDRPFNVMNSYGGLEIVDSLLNNIEQFKKG